MSAVKQIQAVARDRVGKGAARAVRRQGQVPAVIYGAGEPADADRPRLQRDQAADLRRPLPDHDLRDRRRRQEDPRHPARLPARPGQGLPGPCRLPAPRRGPGDQGRWCRSTSSARRASPGVKRGGTLNIVEHAVELLVPVDAIPDAIEASVAGLDIGDRRSTSSDIKLPEGAKAIATDELDPRHRSWRRRA